MPTKNTIGTFGPFTKQKGACMLRRKASGAVISGNKCLGTLKEKDFCGILFCTEYGN
jgi:hypothetical protein